MVPKFEIVAPLPETIIPCALLPLVVMVPELVMVALLPPNSIPIPCAWLPLVVMMPELLMMALRPRE
jgi:hypothetical protein